LLLAGCGGGGSDQLNEGAVRDCLANAGFGLATPPAAGGETGFAPAYLNTAPDFTVYAKSGAAVDAVILGDPERARQTAAHARSALATFGAPNENAQASVLAVRNAVVVFHRPASGAVRNAIRSCLG
jgi:hypothetical protein